MIAEPQVWLRGMESAPGSFILSGSNAGDRVTPDG